MLPSNTDIINTEVLKNTTIKETGKHTRPAVHPKNEQTKNPQNPQRPGLNLEPWMQTPGCLPFSNSGKTFTW